jgi:beta-mannosidase
MRRAFRPVQLLLTDEGTNGLSIHIVNETGVSLDLELEVACLRDGRQSVVSGRRDVSPGGRSRQKIACTDLFGAFFDTTYAFRFGPPSHDVTVARLRSLATGALVAEAFHFPLGRAKAFHPAIVEAVASQHQGEWVLDVQADRFAQSVHIDVDGYRVEDDWFHLAPGIARRLKLTPLGAAEGDAAPKGRIRTLGNRHRVEF